MFGFGRNKPRPAPIYNDPNALPQAPMGGGDMTGMPLNGGIGPSPGFQMPGMQAGQVGLPGMPGMNVNRLKPNMPGMNGKIGLPGMPGINANRFKMSAPPGMGGIGKALGGIFGFGKKKKPAPMGVPVQPPMGGIAPSPGFIE